MLFVCAFLALALVSTLHGASDLNGLAKTQEAAHRVLKKYHKSKSPHNDPPGKFHRSAFSIQKIMAHEYASFDPTARRKSIDKRIKDHKKFMKAATEGGSLHFARKSIAKGLYAHMTKSVLYDGIGYGALDNGASVYLHECENELVNPSKMSDILAMRGDATLIFAIDNTASMSGYISAAKAIAKQIVNRKRNSKVNYILSPFNDPTNEDLVIKKEATKKNEFVSAIDNLSDYGGGDCPEEALTGILNGLKKEPHLGSSIFVFTDASAKDDTQENIDNIEGQAYSGEHSITFFADKSGCGSGVGSFDELADATEGHVFDLDSDREIIKLAGHVQNKMDQNTRLLSGGALKADIYSVWKQYTFKVDSGIKKLHISVVVESQHSGYQIKLESPTGEIIRETVVIKKARIYEVVSPKSGTWKFDIHSSVGKFGFSVDAVSSDIIDFSYHFLYQENPRRSRIVPLENPIKGNVNILSLHIGHIDRVDTKTLKFDIVSKDGQTIKSNLPITSMITKDVFQIKMTPPNEQFKIRLTGKTMSGEDFERMSREVAEPVTMHMTPIFAGDEFTAILGAGRVQVQMQILNTGGPDTFDISIWTNDGSVSPSSHTKSLTSRSFIVFYYYPPTDSSFHGRVARILVSAKKRSSGELFKTSFEILLMKS